MIIKPRFQFKATIRNNQKKINIFYLFKFIKNEIKEDKELIKEWNNLLINLKRLNKFQDLDIPLITAVEKIKKGQEVTSKIIKEIPKPLNKIIEANINNLSNWSKILIETRLGRRLKNKLSNFKDQFYDESELINYSGIASIKLRKENQRNYIKQIQKKWELNKNAGNMMIELGKKQFNSKKLLFFHKIRNLIEGKYDFLSTGINWICDHLENFIENNFINPDDRDQFWDDNLKKLMIIDKESFEKDCKEYLIPEIIESIIENIDFKLKYWLSPKMYAAHQILNFKSYNNKFNRENLLDIRNVSIIKSWFTKDRQMVIIGLIAEIGNANRNEVQTVAFNLLLSRRSPFSMNYTRGWKIEAYGREKLN